MEASDMELESIMSKYESKEEQMSLQKSDDNSLLEVSESTEADEE